MPGIFAPALRRTLQELRDDPEARVVRKDVRSADWDGGTDLSGGPDTAATKGYFFDYSAGAIQAETFFNRVSVQDVVLTNETTASTSFVDLSTAGPAVTAITDTGAWVVLTVQASNNAAGDFAIMSYVISGATTRAATDDTAIVITSAAADQRFQLSSTFFVDDLTAGSNTFTAKYRVAANTGAFLRRRIAVFPA